jgi:hypothetical protein
VLTHFQIEMLIYMAGQLSERTTGRLVERAWVVLEEHYKFHDELFALSPKTHQALAILTVRGWRAREALLRGTTGSGPPTPEFIVKLQALVPSTETKHTRANEASNVANVNAMATAATAATATSRQAPQGLDIPWDQMLGFVDVGSLDWDMFAGGTENVGANAAGYRAGNGTGYVSQQDQNNSWM